MEQIPEETTLQLDQPSCQDFDYEPLFGATSPGGTKSFVFLPKNIQNQGAVPKTKMGCSRYGLCHAINAQNEAVHRKDGSRYFELPASLYWDQYLKVNPKAEKEGATLQSSLDQIKKLGFITGYSRVYTIEQMKDAINHYRPIFTGSQNGNWVSVRDKKIYALRTDGRVVGHIFCIVGYDDSGWVAINSYGSSNGVFKIPYNLTDSLFSRYAISDTRDEEVFAKL